MPKVLSYELSSDSINSVIKELGAYQKQIEKKYKEVCKKLADIGAEEAKRRFARGAEDGNDNVTVSVVEIPKGYKIVASGTDVYFIEFGTGDAAGVYYDSDMISNVSVAIYPGSYSEKNTKEYSTYGSWHHDGKKYSQTDAEMPMYYAGKIMREKEKSVIQEVFR